MPEVLPVPPSDCLSPAPVAHDTDPSEKPPEPDRSISEKILWEQLEGKKKEPSIFSTTDYLF